MTDQPRRDLTTRLLRRFETISISTLQAELRPSTAIGLQTAVSLQPSHRSPGRWSKRLADKARALPKSPVTKSRWSLVRSPKFLGAHPGQRQKIQGRTMGGNERLESGYLSVGSIRKIKSSRRSSPRLAAQGARFAGPAFPYSSFFSHGPVGEQASAGFRVSSEHLATVRVLRQSPRLSARRKAQEEKSARWSEALVCLTNEAREGRAGSATSPSSPYSRHSRFPVVGARPR